MSQSSSEKRLSNQPTITLSTFRGARATTPHVDIGTWAEHVDAIREAAQAYAPAKTAMLAIGPYRLHEGATRADKNVEVITLLAIDVDACDVEALLSALAEMHADALVYSTASDDPDGPDDARRVRVIARPSREITPDECEHTRLAFAESLGLAPGCGAEKALDASRIFFVGRLHDTPERDVWTPEDASDLMPVDVDALLARPLAHAWGSSPARKGEAVRVDVSVSASDEGGSRAARATLAVLAPRWSPAGVSMGRHELIRAIGGYCARSGWSNAEIAWLVARLPSATASERVKQALECATRARRGEQAPGWEALAAWLADDSVARDELEAAVTGYRAARMQIRPEVLERRAANDAAAAGPRGVSVAEQRANERSAPGNDGAVDAVIAALARPELGVYQRAGSLVCVTREACDVGGVIRPVGAPTIRSLTGREGTARLGEIIRATGHDKRLALDVLARREWTAIRPLDAIVTYPVLRRDGTLLASSGYDAATRTIAEIRVHVDVPEAPTLADARAAVETLSNLVCDFPFANTTHRAAWLAGVLTVVARPAINGPTPMLLLDASSRGSGKTLLADVVSLITTGESAPRRTAPATAEEWRKVVFAMLRAGDPIALIDNVTHMLASAALDAMLTGTVYRDRVLGVSEEEGVAVRTFMIASANNCRISTDLVRRSLHCRLEPETERPETRTGFAHDDLLGHVRAHRSRYLAAALTVVRAYAAAGRPRVDGRPMGSYESWCRVVRDALVWAGADDPAATQDGLREDSDVERDELRDLLTAWHDMLGDRAVTVRELLDAATTGRMPSESAGAAGPGGFARGGEDAGRALLDALRGIMPNGTEPSANGVGQRLKARRGQIVGGLVLAEGPKARAHRSTWRVRRV